MNGSWIANRSARLGAGSLIFAIGIDLTQERMVGDYSHLVLLLIALVPFVVTVALVVGQAPAGNEPTALTSTLCGLAFAYGALAVVRLGVLLADRPFTHAGTVTWMALLVTATGFALTAARRSAAVALLAHLTLAVTLLAGADWIFNVGKGIATYRVIALVVAVVFVFLALRTDEWPRRSSVLLVAAGLLLTAIAVPGITNSPQSAVTSLSVATPAHGTGWGWEVIVALGGLGLAWLASRRRDPGVGWASALTLVAFLALAARGSGSPSLVGWPLVFLLLAAVVLGPAIGKGAGRPTARPGALAAGSLLLALAVGLAEVRMQHVWSHLVLLLVVLVPFALTIALALAQPREGDAPSGATSLLAVLALVYWVIVVVRLVRVVGVDGTPHPGTLTWVGVLLLAVGVFLTKSRRTAAVALLTFVFGALTAVAAIEWIFSSRDVHTIAYVLFAVAGVYLLIAVAGLGWPRLGVVAAVAAGGAVVVGLFALVLITGLSSSDQGPHLGWGWEITAVIVALATAGVAALRREAGPAYTAAFVASSVVEIDLARILLAHGQAHPSLAAIPVELLVLGGLLALSAAGGARRAT